MKFRVEEDLLGQCSIPDDVYWGIHTFRARENFQFKTQTVGTELINALAIVKKACCLTNIELGYIDERTGSAITRACDEIIAGEHNAQFILDSLQGGAGTSTNMNANEVIANRALELMGYEKGDYSRCHPLEHVNKHQSTNDVYPTALKVAAIGGIRKLSTAAAALQGAFQLKEKEWAGIVTIGRTELQDAVPITLGAQFGSFSEAIARDRWRTFKCEERLRVVNLGGTAVGTGLTAPRRYIFLATEKLRQLTGYGLARGENMMEQTANADVFVEVSGILSALSSNLQKIGNDLRMLHFSKEIELPPAQAGSSIMPGKVNPVILEAVISTAVKARANHRIIEESVCGGTLQINEFLPLISQALLESIRILTEANRILALHVEAIKANHEVCESHTCNSLTLITAFLPEIGYENAEKLVKEFKAGAFVNVKEFLKDKLGDEVVERVLAPAALMSLGYREKNNKS